MLSDWSRIIGVLINLFTSLKMAEGPQLKEIMWHVKDRLEYRKFSTWSFSQNCSSITSISKLWNKLQILELRRGHRSFCYRPSWLCPRLSCVSTADTTTYTSWEIFVAGDTATMAPDPELSHSHGHRTNLLGWKEQPRPEIFCGTKYLKSLIIRHFIIIISQLCLALEEAISKLQGCQKSLELNAAYHSVLTILRSGRNTNSIRKNTKAILNPSR